MLAVGLLLALAENNVTGLVLLVPITAISWLLFERLGRTTRLSRPYALPALWMAILHGLLGASCITALLQGDAAGAPLRSLILLTVFFSLLAAYPALRWPRRAIAGFVLLSVGWIGVGAGSEPATRAAAPGDSGNAATRPNVVLIVLDTTRRDHLGCYGHTGGLTPNADRVAGEGTVYEDAISPSPWTVPSHASMFTGLHPMSHGCSYEHHNWLDDDFATIGEMLRDAGYETCAIYGNDHVKLCNIVQGFDTSIYTSERFSALMLAPIARSLGWPARWVDKGSTACVAELRRWFARRDRTKPFCLFINLFEPHAPYLPPIGARRDGLPRDVGLIESTRFGYFFDPVAAHIRKEKDARVQQLAAALYRAEVRYQDQRLGQLLDLLRADRDLDNTLLIVTADHGENLGELGRWEHTHAVNETLLHVPLIIRMPSHFPPGTRLKGLCQTTDLVPTIFDTLGIACPVEGLPGRSLLPSKWRASEFAYAQEAPFYWHFGLIQATLGWRARISDFDVIWRTIRDGRHKFVWASSGAHAVYDLLLDPLEAVNLLDQLPEKAAELHERLDAWRATQKPYVFPTEPLNPSPIEQDVIRRLRGLGYIK
jgi:arylsulfatase A-like enzyme